MAIPGATLGARSGAAHMMCAMRPIAVLLLLVSMMFPSAGSIANAEETPMKPSVSYRTVKVDGLSIFYREAGRKDAPTLLLLHGLPSSSRMFEPLFSRLSDRYHLIAPDYPGFGHSDWPDPKKFAYTFDHLATVIEHFTEALGIAKYTLYMQDYGGPVGFRMVLAHPERVDALIVQDAVAHNTGLGANWKTRREYWADRAANEAALRVNLLSLAAAGRDTSATIPTSSDMTPTSRPMSFTFSISPDRRTYRPTCSTTTVPTSMRIPSGRRGCARTSRDCW